LNLIAQLEKIPIEQTVAIGDGANDLLMMNASSLGIAYNVPNF
jgi:phosphoserine phosphatase